MPTPTNNIASAIAAYSKLGKNNAPGLGASDKMAGESFSDLLKGALENAKEIGKTSESRSLGAVKDDADLHQVVTAVSEAEITLRTVVTVRDKVIEAYREIIRMPI